MDVKCDGFYPSLRVDNSGEWIHKIYLSLPGKIQGDEKASIKFKSRPHLDFREAAVSQIRDLFKYPGVDGTLPGYELLVCEPKGNFGLAVFNGIGGVSQVATDFKGEIVAH